MATDTPAPAEALSLEAERERVLRLVEGTTPVLSSGDFAISATAQRDGHPRYLLTTLCGAVVAELPRIQPRNKADAHLFSAAPSLARQYADLLERHAAALARASAASARVRELERVLRNASATLGWYAYSGNYKTNYAPDGDPGKSDVMRDAGSRARGERASVLAVLAQAGSARDGLRAYGEEGE